MCQKSETIGKLAAALVAFSGEMKSIAHDSQNPHFKSSYTSLDHMIDETKPVLTKHGLTVMQFPGGDGERITVRTMILHTSGEWMESEALTLKAVKTDPQGAGSAITYARRYSYAAALSLSLGDDDDGNAASTPPQTARTASQPQRSPYTPSQPQSAPHSQPQRPQGESVGSVAARVYKLREEMDWGWPDLTSFAAEVLGREVKFLKKDVTSLEDWKRIEEMMTASKNGMERDPRDRDYGGLTYEEVHN